LTDCAGVTVENSISATKSAANTLKVDFIRSSVKLIVIKAVKIKKGNSLCQLKTE
jgi:hypothetical protein